MLETGGYIDIHSHIIPGVDDGAIDLYMTRKMLSQSYDQGIRAIIATPHFNLRSNRPTTLLYERLELVQKEAFTIDPNFQIFLGNEIYYENGCLLAVQQKKALTMADSRYVLIEFAPNESYSTIYQAMQDFILSGYFPIIAHIERYDCLRKNQNRIEGLVELGCYLQANANSFLGGILDGKSTFLRKLLGQGNIHFIATDSHDVNHRSPKLEPALRKLGRWMEEEELHQVLFVNPSRILCNKYI